MLMVSSSRWGSFFDVVDSGLLVKLTELWMKNSKPPPGPRRRLLNGVRAGSQVFALLMLFLCVILHTI